MQVREALGYIDCTHKVEIIIYKSFHRNGVAGVPTATNIVIQRGASTHPLFFCLDGTNLTAPAQRKLRIIRPVKTMYNHMSNLYHCAQARTDAMALSKLPA